MKAAIFEKVGQPLRLVELPQPKPQKEELLIRVRACGLCRTDLHLVDGELKDPKVPIVPGHQIVGVVEQVGGDVQGVNQGDRVGVPWLGKSCGHCPYCQEGRENLCDEAKFTGYHIDGGMAEFCVVDHRFCFPIPEGYPDDQAAPLLCAGLIGYRAWRQVGHAQHIGFYGFGSAAHVLIQVANFERRSVYAFTRPGDNRAQSFACQLGAQWVGGSDEQAPQLLDAAIIFASEGSLIPKALRDVRQGGKVICAGIHMSDIPSFPYSILWGERSLSSIANLTRRDGEDFLALAPQIPIKTKVNLYSLEKINEALDDLRHGRFEGSAVIHIG